MESALTDIPTDYDKKKIDYKTSMEVYENYWSQCTDSYIWGIEKSFEISIDELLTPLAELNVRSLEQRKVEKIMYFLVEMPDKDK